MTTPLEYAVMGAETIMRKFKPEELPPVRHFHYHQGVFLSGVERVGTITGDKKYDMYIKAWADANIDKNGECRTGSTKALDDIQPGVILFNLYRKTGDERYKIMLDRLFELIEKWPTNAKGGVWHAYFGKNEMWLDSMYMMGVFTSMYAREFNKPYMFEKVYHQIKLIYQHMYNPETGLLYHMWDDSKLHCPPADRETGLVKVHWGRAMGWYAAALADIIELLPEDNYIRQETASIEKSLIEAILRYQDQNSGLWYQVVDKINDSRNWTESSCSALFAYAIAKSVRLGIVPQSCAPAAVRGYEGIIKHKIELQNDNLIMKDICVGTGVGNYEFYLTRPTSENDLHGMGAFLMMCTEPKIMEGI